MTRISRTASAIAAVAVAVTTIAIAPAAAQSDKGGAERKPEPRSAEATATVQDVSGLSVTRTWKIDKDDPNTLVTKIAVSHPTSAPITTSIVEPIPTTSLERITFRPLTMQTSSIPGLGRYDITVPNGESLKFGYTARLTKDKKATAQNRLDTVKNEMEATLPGAQPTDADRANAAMTDRYAGPLDLTEETSEGVIEDAGPELGPVGTNILRLTPALGCRVVSRGCRFNAQDSFVHEPKLAALEPSGTALVATGSADIAETGLTCDGTEASGVMVKSWTIEPSAWRLTWAGWEVSQVRFTVVGDLSMERRGPCVAASVHTVTTGSMNADPLPTIRQ